MTTILKQLLAKRGILSMEAQAAEDEEKAKVGDGGSTPDGSEAKEPEEITPTTPPEKVPPTEEVPSKEEEEAGTAGESGEAETPNPEEGGAEPPAGETQEDDEFDDEDESDEDDDFDEDELDETVEELSETQKADLAMIDLIDKVRETLADGGLSGREATMVADRAGAILGKIEIEASPTPAMECFGSFGDRRTSTQLALEALQEDQKAVEQKKEGLFAKLMKFIRELWKSLFGNKEVFNRQKQVALERATKIEGNQEVTLKGTEGYAAGYAAMVGNEKFSTGDLAGAMNQLSSEVKALVAKFATAGGNDDCPEDFVENFLKQTRVMYRLGYSRETYVEATKEYEKSDIVISVNAAQQKQMVLNFASAFETADKAMSDVESQAKRAFAAGNSKQLHEVLAVLRMVTNMAKSGPALGVRLAVKSEKSAA